MPLFCTRRFDWAFLSSCFLFTIILTCYWYPSGFGFSRGLADCEIDCDGNNGFLGPDIPGSFAENASKEPSILPGPESENQHISLGPGQYSTHQSGQRLAYATLLTGGLLDADPDYQNNMFIAARILTYQLLHAEETKTRKDIPFLILVTESVPKEQRDELQRAGAQLIPVESVFVGSEHKWLAAEDGIWDDALTKFRAWDVLTDYSRVVMLDVNTILTKSLDDIFDLPESQLLRTLSHPDANPSESDPEHDRDTTHSTTYLLAGTAANTAAHHSPLIPSEDIPDASHLSDSLLVFSPSPSLYQHYMNLITSTSTSDPITHDCLRSSRSSSSSSTVGHSPVSRILSHAHCSAGRVPWTQLPPGWTVDVPRAHDVHLVRSMRARWWMDGGEEVELDRYLRMWRWRMEGYHEWR